MTKTLRRRPAAISRKEASLRTVAIAAVNGIALIHVLEIPHKLEHAPYMAGLFAALILACATLSALLTTADARSAPALWSAAGTLAAATMAGYAASRSIGLPGLA